MGERNNYYNRRHKSNDYKRRSHAKKCRHYVYERVFKKVDSNCCHSNNARRHNRHCCQNRRARSYSSKSSKGCGCGCR